MVKENKKIYKTAEEIAPIWKKQFIVSAHRLFIKETIVKLYNILPNNDDYILAQQRLSETLDALWYISSDTLDGPWGNIYTTLMTLTPITLKTSESPEWLLNLYEIYNAAQKRRTEFKSPIITDLFY